MSTPPTASLDELMLPKGMRDLDPEHKILQLEVLDTIRSLFERYGYLPIETPMVERMDVLKAKFGAGEGTDVSKEIFQVTDQGDRELGLRFDMTIPLCRYVAMNPSAIKLPFKRYAMGQVFRDGPIKLGRYREFWQADADIIGASGALADAEGVMLAADVFRSLELDVTMRFSSRELLAEMMDTLEIAESQRSATIIALDKLKKIGAEEVLKEMIGAGVLKSQGEKLLEITSCSGTNEEKIESLRSKLPESPALSRLEETMHILKDVENLVFDPTLARGLGYYTGFFFEAFLKKSKITSSLLGSGRYDKVIGQYLQGKQEFAAVGISFGVSVICDALLEKRTVVKKSASQVYVMAVSPKELPQAQEVAHMLRASGVNTDMDLLQRSIGKNFSYADSLGIPYVVVIGADEAKKKSCTVKIMSSGEQLLVEVSQLLTTLESFSQK